MKIKKLFLFHSFYLITRIQLSVSIMNKSYLLLLFVLCVTGCKQPIEKDVQSIHIIPQPNQLSVHEGQFELNHTTKIVYKGLDKTVLNTISYFQSLIKESTDIDLQIIDSQPPTNFISFAINNEQNNNPEAYALEVSSNEIAITASSAQGLFYAIQSLRQLLPNKTEKNNHWIIPALYIKDYPRFSYRGLNLDVARHFFSIEDIKKQIDILALYKINVFHWHLTDDQGWRIEIKKYPKLTKIGSRRSKTVVGHAANIPLKYNNEVYEGYYSQEDIKEVVKYAQERHITIIPEIEMPGHALAALASYPELGCTGGPYEVATRWGGFDDVICPGKESSYVILKDILTEVAQLFPGQYIHIGGDECTKIRWRNCKHCQQRISDYKLADENELELFFIKRIQKIVESLGKSMVGWDEIMTDKSLSNATIVVWQDDAEIKDAIKNNNKIVQSPNSYLYFDHYQCEPQNHPLAIGGYTPLKDVYCYEPVSDNLTEEESKSVIGIQANCWTEYISDSKKVDYMLYPRLCAFSEISWIQKSNKDWAFFMQKLDTHQERLSELGVNYFYEVPKPIVENEQLNFTHPTTMSFKHISNKYEIRYTTNGSEPTNSSKLFTHNIAVKKSGTIKAITINKETGDKSKTAIITLNQLSFQKPLKKSLDKLSGLRYSLHKGRFKTVKEIQNISKSESGIARHSFLPDSAHNEGYGLIYNGYFHANDKGIYEFSLNSDDGSALYINNKLVVNNDGIHGKKVEKGAIALSKGMYDAKIYYFQTTGYQYFNLNVISPDGTETRLIPSAFFYD